MNQHGHDIENKSTQCSNDTSSQEAVRRFHRQSWDGYFYNAVMGTIRNASSLIHNNLLLELLEEL